MFLVISWVLTGAVLGSVGVAAIASAMASEGPRGDDFQSALLMLLMTTVLGAAGGGMLGARVRRRLADNPRRLNQLALPPLLGAAGLVFGVMLYTGGP